MAKATKSKTGREVKKVDLHDGYGNGRKKVISYYYPRGRDYVIWSDGRSLNKKSESFALDRWLVEFAGLLELNLAHRDYHPLLRMGGRTAYNRIEDITDPIYDVDIYGDTKTAAKFRKLISFEEGEKKSGIITFQTGYDTPSVGYPILRLTPHRFRMAIKDILPEDASTLRYDSLDIILKNDLNHH
ncbi:MAG: hypothetical protein GXP63_07205 [DPANN group archaeon]|nr:hypothetical protein [DPANN group archaeon]